MTELKSTIRIGILATALVAHSVPAFADAISPRIDGRDQTYSKEAPNEAFYGNSSSARLSEASELRFRGERDTQDGNYDLACKRLAKAVQLDPADPSSHLLYARALTAKAASARQPDLKTYKLAIQEWKLIWHHDADALEQMEGKAQTRRLSKIVKKIERVIAKGGNPSAMVAAKQTPKDDDSF